MRDVSDGDGDDVRGDVYPGWGKRARALRENEPCHAMPVSIDFIIFFGVHHAAVTRWNRCNRGVCNVMLDNFWDVLIL